MCVLKNISQINYRSIHVILAAFVFLMAPWITSQDVRAQNPPDWIQFGKYHGYELDLYTQPNPKIDFGMVLLNEGLVNKNIADALIIEIEGIRYLDVIVELQADDYIVLDGDIANRTVSNKRIPFTLKAAYANRGADNTNHAILFPAGNTTDSRFQIRHRTTVPPGPPPTPTHEGYNPNLHKDTAYLYLYGSLNVGNIHAGAYSGEINVTVYYD